MADDRLWAAVAAGVLPAEDRFAALLRSIVDVARSLDRETVGERVNDERTLELMKQLGVDYAQGFHLGPPTPVS